MSGSIRTDSCVALAGADESTTAAAVIAARAASARRVVIMRSAWAPGVIGVSTDREQTVKRQMRFATSAARSFAACAAVGSLERFGTDTIASSDPFAMFTRKPKRHAASPMPSNSSKSAIEVSHVDTTYFLALVPKVLFHCDDCLRKSNTETLTARGAISPWVSVAFHWH